MKFPEYPKTIRIMFLVYIIGFSIGTITHTLDLLNHGIILNENVPIWKNIYWVSLTFFDFLAIILILRTIIPALVISNLIIVSDVIINTNGFTFSILDIIGYRIFTLVNNDFCLAMSFHLAKLENTNVVCRFCSFAKRMMCKDCVGVKPHHLAKRLCGSSF